MRRFIFNNCGLKRAYRQKKVGRYLTTSLKHEKEELNGFVNMLYCFLQNLYSQEVAREPTSCLPTRGVGSANLWSGRSRLTRTRSARTGCPHLLPIITEDEVVGAPKINTELGRIVFDPDKPNVRFLRLVATSFMNFLLCS